MNNSTRIIGLDIVRLCASFFTIAGHFFGSNTNLYSTPFDGTLFMQGVMDSFFRGVPLFLMLTGYWQNNKGIDKKYYKSCIRVILYYLILSIITILFRKYYFLESFDLRHSIESILNFSAIPYAWYIEMWLGLFLLIPFLNKLFKSLSGKREKLILIFSLMILTSLPNLGNREGYYLVPAYWEICYPLMFYFIGSYIKEYQPQIKLFKSLLILIATCTINPIATLIFTSDRSIIHIIGNSYNPFGVLISTIFFLLVYQLKIKNKTIGKFITFAAPLSLGVYLICFCFDALYYPYFKEHFFENQAQFGWFFFIIVPLVYLSSLLVAYLADKLIAPIINKWVNKD